MLSSFRLLRGWLWVLAGFMGCVVSFSGCQFFQSQESSSGYRPDEQALLEIAIQNIRELEEKKDYATLYDDYGSQDFKQRVSQRDFLKLANCTETHLGGFKRIDPETLVFVRKAEKGQPVDILNLKVYRTNGELVERLVFIQENLAFKFNSFRWLSTRPSFLGCLEEVNRKKGMRNSNPR